MKRFDHHCPINIGDSWAQVQAALNISALPDPYFDLDEPSEQKGWEFHLPSSGIYIFLDDSLHIRTLRFDAPFLGSIDGVRIGDSSQSVRQIKGECDRHWPVHDGVKIWLYDKPFIRFDFDADTDTVMTIFL